MRDVLKAFFQKTEDTAVFGEESVLHPVWTAPFSSRYMACYIVSTKTDKNKRCSFEKPDDYPYQQRLGEEILKKEGSVSLFLKDKDDLEFHIKPLCCCARLFALDLCNFIVFEGRRAESRIDHSMCSKQLIDRQA